ncbi:MAG TPA: hypothetical protein VFL99_00550 [Segeticoccus sp.]|uniref:LolA family protein n=1 Tax=Segeticoccus sp. TaxID=2706531 RepID=UPI002D8045F8|nr:hypothetical protein [Segeticoccus sp.]HET8598783.1 hypothetical protein [Segeticoccus sp.]
MPVFSEHPSLRWAVPATAAVVVVGGGSAVGAMTASADTGLPHRSAAQLLVDVQKAHVTGLSGTVVQKADLGLPDLSALAGGAGGPGGSGGGGSSDLTSLISGTHTMRVWFAGPTKARMALLGTLGESDVIRNGRNVWVWSSKDRTAAHYVLPAKGAEGKQQANPTPSELPTSPQQAARQALKGLNPSTAVTTSGTATVAGRAAYELVLKPKSNQSLVSQVRIAIDGKTHVPLRVQVYATKGSTPAFEVGFSSVSFSKPDAAQFAFNPPPGTKVTTKDLGGPGQHLGWQHAPGTEHGAQQGAPGMSAMRHGMQGMGAHGLKVVGKAWDSVLVGHLPKGSQAKMGQQGGQLGEVLRHLPKVSGSWGSGRILTSRLFTVVLTNDGRVAVGAVTPQAIYSALAK